MVEARRGGSRRGGSRRSYSRSSPSSYGYSGRSAYASEGSRYGRKSDVDLETEIAQWWNKTQDVVTNMLSTWAKRHGEEQAYWQGGGVLDNSSFVEAIKNGSEEIKDTIVHTLNQTMPMMQNLSMLIEEQKADDKDATEAYMQSRMTDQRRQNISDVMENITNGIMQGYNTLQRQMGETAQKVQIAQRQSVKKVFQRRIGVLDQRFKTNEKDPMFDLSVTAQEGMRIVRNQFRNVQREVRRAPRNVEDATLKVSRWVKNQAREAQRAAQRP